MAKKEGDGRAYYDCVMHKIQNSIRNIFATTVDTQDQKTDPDSQCPTEHTKTNPTATPFLVVEILSAKKSRPIYKVPSVSLRPSRKIQ